MRRDGRIEFRCDLADAGGQGMPIVRVAPLSDIIVLFADHGEAVEIACPGQRFDVGDVQRGERGGQFDDHSAGRAIRRTRCCRGSSGRQSAGLEAAKTSGMLGCLAASARPGDKKYQRAQD